MRGRTAAGIAVLVAAQIGCVSIHHLDDPAGAVQAARAEAERAGTQPGPAHRVHVLAFDPDEGTLVRVSVPVWLASKIEGHARHDDDAGRALERGLGADLARHIHIRDLAAAGRGLIADVEDDDGSQVLVWLR